MMEVHLSWSGQPGRLWVTCTVRGKWPWKCRGRGSRRRAQPVQRPWGGMEPGVLEEGEVVSVPGAGGKGGEGTGRSCRALWAGRTWALMPGR